MATLVFSAVGTALGGPLGGSISALIGNQVDQLVFKPHSREGPRLKELNVTTSSYGTPIARHFGRLRVAGSVIWATELVETSEKSGGGKGRPSTTTYSYASSFAVALASQPIQGVGRIWADGNLLRGVAGDLKVGGELRIYTGYGDQSVDPLIAAAQGDECPAFRGIAYCVFESLQLGDFGNRIPALSFELIADDGAVLVQQLVAPSGIAAQIDRPLPGLAGFSDEGGSLAANLATVGHIYPFSCDAGGEELVISQADGAPSSPPTLPEAIADPGAEDFAPATGRRTRRNADAGAIPSGLRYYDTGRDYQPGLQRVEGRARAGRPQIIEFPGALDAAVARNLANAAAERATWSRETLSWRVADLDPDLSPGDVVRVPGKGGYWRIEEWEWSDTGIALELVRLPFGPARVTPADGGTALAPSDAQATPTVLAAYELPWDGQGSSETRQIYAAPSSSSAGWAGAQLYAEKAGALVPIGATGRTRSIVGVLAADLPAAQSVLLDRANDLLVNLASTDFALSSATLAALAAGANTALVGGEVIQFVRTEHLGGTTWRLTGLLRGRGGSEALAAAGHAAGATFVLLDGKPLALDVSLLGEATDIAAIGLADSAPVTAAITASGRSLQPLMPVHPRTDVSPDGTVTWRWTRRARGAWSWPELVEVALNEESESYLVGLGDTTAPALHWNVSTPSLELDAATMAQIAADHSGSALWVRQLGRSRASDPLLLAQIA